MTLGSAQYLAAADPLRLRPGGAGWIGQGHGAAEAGSPIKAVAQFVQQTVNPLVVAGGVAGRKNTRSSIQCIHLDA